MTVGSILQAIADLLATATSETEYNIIRFWKETLQQYRFLYDIQQRNVDDHSNVTLQLMARSMVDGATSSLTFAIDTWRALTELNALAKEYDDFNKKYPQK